MSGFTPYMAAAWKAGVEEGRPTDIAWRTKRRLVRSRAMLGMRPASSAASKISRERPSICTTRRRRRAVASAEPSLVQRAIRSTVPWSLRTRSSIMMRAASPGRSRARVYRASRAFGSPLHLAAYGDRDHLEEAADDAPILPALVRHLLGAGQVVGEHALQAPGDTLVVDDQVDLVVQPEGAIVEVGASHRRPLAVDHHGLGVEERRAVLVDSDAGEEETAQLRATRLAHQVVVDGPGKEEPHTWTPRRAVCTSVSIILSSGRKYGLVMSMERLAEFRARRYMVYMAVLPPAGELRTTWAATSPLDWMEAGK